MVGVGAVQTFRVRLDWVRVERFLGRLGRDATSKKDEGLVRAGPGRDCGRRESPRRGRDRDEGFREGSGTEDRTWVGLAGGWDWDETRRGGRRKHCRGLGSGRGWYCDEAFRYELGRRARPVRGLRTGAGMRLKRVALGRAGAEGRSGKGFQGRGGVWVRDEGSQKIGPDKTLRDAPGREAGTGAGTPDRG